MASKELIEKSKVLLANTFVVYMKAHGYHWNVIGINFPELHKFFGKLYEDLHGSVDDIAEQIRSLEAFSPGTLARFKELATISEDEKIPTPEKMIDNLYDAVEELLDNTKEIYELAESEKEYAYSNFLQDRLTALKKHCWMLRVTSGEKP